MCAQSKSRLLPDPRILRNQSAMAEFPLMPEILPDSRLKE